MSIKTHKKVIYIGFGGFAIIKAAIFFFGIIAGVFGIGNVFADSSNCSTLTGGNLKGPQGCCTLIGNTILNCNNKGINNVDISDVDVWPCTTLLLNNNDISDLDKISNLHELFRLELGGNNISDIEPLSKMTSLSRLVLANNKIVNLSGLDKLVNLSHLDLQNNKITDITILGNLKTLTTVYLNNNYITNLPIFYNLQKDLYMRLNNNQIEDISPLRYSLEYKFEGNNDFNGGIDMRDNCLDLSSPEISNIQNKFSEAIIVAPQRNCSNWTGQDVLLNFLDIADSFDDDEGSCESSGNVTPYFCPYQYGDMECTEYTTGNSYLITCNPGEICQTYLDYYFVDDEGNSCGTGNTLVQIDKKAPSCEIIQLGEKTGNNIYRPTNQRVKLSISPIDEGIGKISYTGYKRNDEDRAPNNTTNVLENGTYHVMVSDAVGNKTGCSISVSNIDHEKPAPAIGTTSACFSGNINVAFQEMQHEEGSGFGGSYIVYTTGESELNCNGNRWDDSLNFIDTTHLTVGVCDEAGNIATGRYTYALDKAPITTIVGYDGQWTGNDLSLVFEIDDGDELCKKSGKSETHYCIYSAESTVCSPNMIGSNLSVTCTDGQVCETFVQYYSVNASGMAESMKTGLILIDKEAPTCTINQNPSKGIYTSDTVILTASADDGIGSNEITYNWTGDFGDIVEYIVSNNGNYTMTVKDLVGNESECDIDIDNIDKNDPIIRFSPMDDDDSKKSRTISIIADDDLAGFTENQNFKYYRSDEATCSDDEALYDNGNFEPYNVGDKRIGGFVTRSTGDGYKYLCVGGGITDQAGNISQIASGGAYLFDNTGPTGTIQILYNGNTKYASGYILSLILTGADLYSSVSGMQFSCDNSNWSNEEMFEQNKNFDLSNYSNYGCNTGEGTKIIYVRYIDSLGNIGSPSSGSIILDTTAPTCTIDQAGCTSGDLLLTLNANENINTPNEWTKISNKIFTNNVTNNDIVSVQIKDLAGNLGTCSTWITNHDVSGPTIVFTDISTNECTAVTWNASAEDIGCAGITSDNAYNFSATSFGEGNWGGAILDIKSSQVPKGGTKKTQELVVRDSLGNESELSAVLTINDTKPTITTKTGDAGLLTGEKTYGNVVSILDVRDGECGTGTINTSLVGECTNATGIINNNILTIIPNQDYEGNGICTISFTDDEGSSVVGYVEFSIDTEAPDIANCTENACFKGTKQVVCSGPEDEEGNKIVYTTDDTELSCNSDRWTDKVFTGSTTLKIAVCDSADNMSEVTTYRYILDYQKPSTTLSGLPSGWTGQDVNSIVNVEDNCGIFDTYYCISEKDGGQCTNYTKVESNNIIVPCDDGMVCEKYLWYYSIDDAGNQENIKQNFIQIDKKELTCSITYDSQCTNSGIILTLEASKELSNTLFGWERISEDDNKYTKIITWNEDINIPVFDHINNSYTCTASVQNFDNINPIINSLDLYTGYECGTITISPDITDDGCSSNELQYLWDDYTGNATKTLEWRDENSLDIQSTKLTAIDSVGNSTTRTIKYQWIDIPISGADISVYNVGNGTGIKWKDYVYAGECDIITASIINSGSIGNCEFQGNLIKYSPNPGSVGNDVCQLQISDGDSNIDISIMWYGIDNLMPTIIGFTGGLGDICTNQDSLDIVLSFNKPVTGINTDTITGEYFIINSFDEYSGYQYTWNISLSGGGTGVVWINTGNIIDLAGNSLVGSTSHLILGNYDNIGPTTPELNELGNSDISKITLSRSPSTTTGCADLDKYEIHVCKDETMETNCKWYESTQNKKSIVKGNGNYYWQVVALDTNGNKSTDSTVGQFTIESENPTCIVEIQENSMCTSGDIELKLTASKAVSFVTNGGINWTQGENNTRIGYTSANGVLDGIIIQDGDSKTGTCDELIVSSFDDTTPSTSLSGSYYVSGGRLWANTDTHLELIATDTGCENDDITTLYCIIESGNNCVPNIEGNSILLTGKVGMITEKYIKYHSIDKAGNIETTKDIVINIDNQAPLCSTFKNTSDITNTTVIISLSGDDGMGIGLDELPYFWSENVSWSNQNYLIVWDKGIYTGYVRDMLGNTKVCNIVVNNIDNIPPEGAECTTSDCFSESINVSCSEKTREDGNYIVYSTDGTSPTCRGHTGNTFEFKDDTVLKVAVCDKANNISEVSTYTYIVDKESPYTIVEGLPGGNGWTGSDVQISLSGRDYGCAGGINTYFRVLNTEDSEVEFGVGNEILVGCNTGNVCVKYIEFYSVDTLGNSGEVMKEVVKIDKEGPSCEIENLSDNGGYTSGFVILKLGGNDGSGVGLGGYSWMNDLGFNNRLSVNTNGVYTGIVIDLLGNRTECSKIVDNIDNIPPSGAECTTDTICYSGAIDVSCVEKDYETGNYIVYTIDGTTPSCNSTSGHNFNITGNNVVKVAVCDKAQNMSEINTYNYDIDAKSPTTTIYGISNDWVGTDVSVNLSANDSGCAGGLKTYYCIDTGNLCEPNISGNYAMISCNTGDICQKYIRYYSIDSLGNRETTKYALAKINHSILSCNISYDKNTCTNSGILVHLNVSEPMSSISGWNQLDKRNYEKIVNKNGKISVTIKGTLGGTYTCSTDIDTYDATAPTLDVNDEYTAYKCEAISIIASGKDSGCQGHDIKYKWDNQIGNSTKTISWNSGYKLNHNYTITLSINDLAGNISEKTIRYKWISTGLTLSTGVLDMGFIGSGDMYTANISDLISKFGVREGKCSTSNISINTGNCDAASLTITGDYINISYTSDGDISCDIVFDNGEGITTTGKLLFQNNMTTGSCLNGWNNDKFLDENFWSKYDGNSITGAQQVICAVWGASGGDMTAYTKGLDTSGYNHCDKKKIKVIETGLLSNDLNNNTIYILDSNEITLSGSIKMPNCSAIISKSGTTLYNTSQYANSGIIYMDGDYIILDNVSLNGYINQTQFNKIGLQIGTYKSHILINNVKSFNNNNGIIVHNNNHVLFNNIMTYNNYDNGLSIGTSEYIAVNNILSFKNGKDGINIGGSDHIILNNIQTFSNTNNGIGEIASNDIITTNNIKSYNEGLTTNISRSNVVNPINKSGGYLLGWTDISAKGYVSNLGQISGYSFGDGVLTQKPPISWIGTNTGTVGNYNRNNFIGSNISNPKFKVSVGNNSSSGWNILVSSDSNLVQKYSVYGNLVSNKTGITIGTKVWIQLKERINSELVLQLYGANLFAVHSVLYHSGFNTSGYNSTGNSYTGDWHNIDTYRYEDGDQSIIEMNGYTRELNNAYKFAYLYKITTKNDIYSADLYGPLTRIAMAKMLSNYAINILGKTPNGTNNCIFGDVSMYADMMYDYGVTNACKLGIMGINMPDNKFRPNDTITRGEFATALSRLLYNTVDGNPYYETHLRKLKSEGILSNTDPNMRETRGYVMLMLMRSTMQK